MIVVERIYLFTYFERFWHWSQAALIITMALTGFEIHGLYPLFGFETAVMIHTTAAWILIGLWIFAIFWHLTTGEWKQYIPTTERIIAVVRYYSLDIFSDKPHPYHRTRLRKHNPLQRLVYLALWVVINPAIWISGWLYLFYNSWSSWGLDSLLDLDVVAFVHAAAAFLIVAFLVGHVYLVTTGRTVFEHVKAMITGWEEVDVEETTKKEQIS